MYLRKSIEFRAITIVLNSMAFFILFLFLFANFTSFEIKHQGLKSFVIYGLIILPLIMIIWSIIKYNNLRKIVFNSIIPLFLLIGVYLIGPMKLIFQTSVYKTQSVYYINIDNPNKRVEYQMQDVGALGYNKRYVEVTHYLGVFMKIKHIEQIKYDEKDWLKVN